MSRAEVLASLDPGRYVHFSSPHHSKRNAAVLGIALGVSFTVCFLTGLLSHTMQHPWWIFDWPARPAGLYRLTQGLHVAAGLFAIPLLFAKLWVVFPKLFEWPPVSGFAQALERLSLPPLIGGGLFMLVTGVANINQWYFFPFYFTTAHYAVGYVTFGALVIHIGAKAGVASAALDRNGDGEKASDGRRSFLLGVFGVGGLISVFTAGQSFSPLGRLALLAPRRPGVGPQGLPVNRSAVAAGVIDKANASDYSLTVDGRVGKPLSFTLADLRALPQRSARLPIACVEGWSADAEWSGVSVRDLLRLADAQGTSVLVQSIEQNNVYAESVLNESHAFDADTLLALDLNGEPLHIDHGYPCRLISPNRPGVMQTKWVKRLMVV